VYGDRDFRLACITAWNDDAGGVGTEYAAKDDEKQDSHRKKDRSGAHQSCSSGEVSVSAWFVAVFEVTTGTAS
jgi:hypothetical protein